MSVYRILGSHGSKQKMSLLECNNMKSGGNHLGLQKTVMPQSSGKKSCVVCSSKTVVNSYLIKIPEDVIFSV
jgi:hypothetical protein